MLRSLGQPVIELNVMDGTPQRKEVYEEKKKKNKALRRMLARLPWGRRDM